MISDLLGIKASEVDKIPEKAKEEKEASQEPLRLVNTHIRIRLAREQRSSLGQPQGSSRRQIPTVVFETK